MNIKCIIKGHEYIEINVEFLEYATSNIEMIRGICCKCGELQSFTHQIFMSKDDYYKSLVNN
jgi:hypothetical protein